MLKEISDEELWRNIKSYNSQSDFNELYNRYWEKLYTNAFFKLKDRDASANIVQDIFVMIWRRKDFLDIECMETYLGCAVRYGVLREQKRTKKAKTILVENELFPSPVFSNDASVELIYKGLEQKVEKELDKLPKRCKEIFLLSRKSQLSSSEIAAIFNISNRTVDNQITIALSHLRMCIKDIVTYMIILGSLFI